MKLLQNFQKDRLIINSKALCFLTFWFTYTDGCRVNHQYRAWVVIIIIIFFFVKTCVFTYTECLCKLSIACYQSYVYIWNWNGNGNWKSTDWFELPSCWISYWELFRQVGHSLEILLKWFLNSCWTQEFNQQCWTGTMWWKWPTMTNWTIDC